MSEGDSPKICEQAISSKCGTITYLLRSAHNIQTRTDVTKKHTSGYTVLGESFDKLGEHVTAKLEDYEFTYVYRWIEGSLMSETVLRGSDASLALNPVLPS